MLIVSYGQQTYDRPTLLVLGCFDALHIGHRTILTVAKREAEARDLDLGVMMFRRGKERDQVFTFEERLAMLAEYGVKMVLAIDYNQAFMDIPAEEFLQTLLQDDAMRGCMSGRDFRFGRQAAGDVTSLKVFADRNGLFCQTVEDVCLFNEKVSTSLIRRCLLEGNVAKADLLLGSQFRLTGVVRHGFHRGGAMGFPTANFDYPAEKCPVKQGVYSVEASVDGVNYRGIANYGGKPTFDDERPLVETHLDGFSGDLYGRTLTVRLVDRIRDICKFDSAEALSSQLTKDLAFIRKSGYDKIRTERQ